MKTYRHIAVLIIAGIVPSAQAASAVSTQNVCQATGSISADQWVRFFALTELFESDQPNPDFGHMEMMIDGTGDGRGYCSGLVSFCSNSDDMADVIVEYTRFRPENPLNQFVPRMRELSLANSGSIKGLDNLPSAWNQCVNDPLFHQAEETIRDREYLEPALRLAENLGVETVLGRFVLYDTAVQHGVGGTEELIARLKKVQPETPASGKISEWDWLLAFIEVRKAELQHAESNEATRDVWNESTPRADALTHMVEDDYWDFCNSIQLRSKDWNETLICQQGKCSTQE